MRLLFVSIVILFATLQKSVGQEIQNELAEENAAVFLDEYTDVFLDTFFEALKQKGIQNYDRAINLLLKCKQLDSTNKAVNHELAKVYFLDEKYHFAQQYATEALRDEPENYWFLANLIDITQKQRIPIQNRYDAIPYENEVLRSNLAKYLFQEAKYNEAKTVLGSIQMTPERSLLLQKINDSLRKSATASKALKKTTETNKKQEEDNPFNQLRKELEALVQINNPQALAAKSNQAIEEYPLQPASYFYKAVALNQLNDYEQAIVILEEGLDYLLNNDALENQFYYEFSKAYKGLGNDVRANEYLNRIKSRF